MHRLPEFESETCPLEELPDVATVAAAVGASTAGATVATAVGASTAGATMAAG